MRILGVAQEEALLALAGYVEITTLPEFVLLPECAAIIRNCRRRSAELRTPGVASVSRAPPLVPGEYAVHMGYIEFPLPKRPSRLDFFAGLDPAAEHHWKCIVSWETYIGLREIERAGIEINRVSEQVGTQGSDSTWGQDLFSLLLKRRDALG